MTKEVTLHFHIHDMLQDSPERGEYTSIYGDKLTKVYKFRKDDYDLFGFDVPETTRALVDLYSESDEISQGHVVLTYDIEVRWKVDYQTLKKFPRTN